MSDRTETPAEVYDRLFLPAMAGPWAVRVADAARPAPGDRVLDVACGTGAVVVETLRRVGDPALLAGIDLSPDMLAVAWRKLAGVDLREGHAESLPFEDGSFDVVTCQFGLMFFDDRGAALREAHRVLRPGGRIVVAVWDRLERTPGYTALTDLVERHLGSAAADPVRAAFALGDPDAVVSLLTGAGFASVDARSVDATACFPSVRTWVEAEVRGWIGGEFGEAEYTALLEDAQRVLSPYRQGDGTVEFDLPAVLATAVRP
ncbi:methyltransferase domain-containing protein [Thalassiella azotivora]